MKQGEAWKLEILAEWLVHGLPVLWANQMFDIPTGDDLKNLSIIYSAGSNCLGRNSPGRNHLRILGIGIVWGGIVRGGIVLGGINQGVII